MPFKKYVKYNYFFKKSKEMVNSRFGMEAVMGKAGRHRKNWVVVGSQVFTAL